MKKIIIIVVIIGMVGWAVFDFVSNSDKSVTPQVEQAGEGTGANEDQLEGNESGGSDGPIDSVAQQKVEGLLVGNVAPDFELTTLEGDVVKLSDFRGERVMLNFWATWCPPCRAEMPDMQQFHEDKDVVILAVNLTKSRADELEKIPGFVEDFGITFSVLLDEENAVANLYRIKPIPTNYLINSDGTIHNMAYGALNYDLMVQEFEKMK